MTERANREGRFIVFEGPDGAGKSVQAQRLAQKLTSRGLAVTLSREPGGTPLGEQVRNIVLDPGDVPRSPVADACLFGAARAQLVRDVIRPALDRGDIVICDRYSTSSMAYQGYGSGVDLVPLAALQSLVTGDLAPDLVVLIDVPVAIGLARRDAGHVDQLTRFEDESRHDLAFHERVRNGYLAMAARDPDHWVVIDGSGPAPAVEESVSRAADVVLLQSDNRGAARIGSVPRAGSDPGD
jgi:dTMP kinase